MFPKLISCISAFFVQVAFAGAISSSSTRTPEIYQCIGAQDFSTDLNLMVGLSKSQNQMIGFIKQGLLSKPFSISHHDYFEYRKADKIFTFVRFEAEGLRLDIHLNEAMSPSMGYLTTSWNDRFGLFGGFLNCSASDGLLP